MENGTDGEDLTPLQRECFQKEALLELSLEYRVAQAKMEMGLGKKAALRNQGLRDGKV